ncbi:TKL/LISK/LISK-DD1 protein kinase [Saprolegnia parasitica CBS 223.65]|uniref:TKL/LISK/LISK-DD1 protein kinase n=1 Tax=Saprolegnia parasitica (strain CBS 223.65) TaxID=695850 RepID=A0A067D3Z3_SAPPC|nr:TKL/LISK/LISK-DD1 protein kinase [Saprolegnia parasitica CBS 223.65]KDO33471.1 TKL/LISK/LISK-DD1 protein kinase [Saprolegnia parasitica CBS 223.65]|eukprot:XP_012196215.1 TKL/LISK/LISK-DD1 protein kinase [Saprolegnia parasitica CBS 223.65]
MPSTPTSRPTSSLAAHKRVADDNNIETLTASVETALMDDDVDVTIEHTLVPGDLTLGPIIGHGAFSTVYSATYKGKAVALKRQTKDAHILRELAILQQIDHPHLLKYIGSCEYEHMGNKEVWIVSEFYKGGDVSKLLKKTTKKRDALSWLQCVQIALDAADALQYLHERSIIHRDVKSANILLDANLRSRLCDFGFARKAVHHDDGHDGYSSDENAGGRMRRKMSLCGTDAYMSPEMYFNEDYNDRADMYSFGVVLIELICRREVNKDDFLLRVPAKNFVIDLDEFHAAVPADCPPSLVLLADNCTSFEPDGRPSSHEVVEWLEDLKKDLVEATPEAFDPLEDEVRSVLDESSRLSIAVHEDEAPPAYEGALLVRNCVGRWRQRYVVVRDSALLVYKSQAIYNEIAQLEADGHQKIKHKPSPVPLDQCQLFQVTTPLVKDLSVFGLRINIPTFMHRLKKKARRWTLKSKSLHNKWAFQAASLQEMQLWVALFVRAIKVAMHQSPSPSKALAADNSVDTNDEIYKWLHALGAAQYYATFKAKGFGTLDFIRETGLGDDDFNFLGIESARDRAALTAAALALRGEDA